MSRSIHDKLLEEDKQLKASVDRESSDPSLKDDKNSLPTKDITHNLNSSDKIKEDGSQKIKPSFFKLQYYNPQVYYNNVLNKTKENPTNRIPLSESSFISSTTTSIYLLIAVIASVISGCTMPLFSFLFGQTVNNFTKKIDQTDFMDIIKQLSFNYLIIGSIMFAVSSLQKFLWEYIGKSLIINIKTMYFKTILEQEQAYFDDVNSFEYSTKVQNQTKIIEMGLGFKVGQTISSLCMGIISIVLGFVISWKLSLVLLSLFPFIAISGAFMAKSTQNLDQKKRETYENAGGIAEEVLYNVKTVASFSNFKFERKRYNDKLEESRNAGYSEGFKRSISLLCMFFLIYASYGLAIWYGSLVIANGDENPLTGEKFGSGDVITVLLSIVFASFSMGISAPNIKAISAACEASSDFFELLDRIPKISNRKNSSVGINKDNIKGEIEFKNVCFGYKKENKEKVKENSTGQTNNNISAININETNNTNDQNTSSNLLFNNLNLKINAGTNVGIVGHSGSGKTTIVNLLERLYEINSGEITIDSVDINQIDINHWRSLIGYVAQEPVLFNTNIRDNIIFGRDERNYTDEEIIEALEKAYAKDFVFSFKEKLDYKAGIKGSKLSGGQKQRIAIARALLDKPKLLIFDEATSALDTQSEKIVKKALNDISKINKTTTIIIAHRLSTVVNCDKIVVLDKGVIVEEGTHSELLEKKGAYFKLIENQLVNESEINKEENTDTNLNKIENNEIEGNENIEILDKSKSNQEDQEINPSIKTNNKTQLSKEEQANKQKEEAEFYAKSKSEIMSIIKEGACIYILLAFISAFFMGAVSPIQGFLISEATSRLGIKDIETMKHETLITALKYFALSILAGFCIFLQTFSFNRIGEHLTYSLRKRVFTHYLKLHLSYFDNPLNSPGALLTKLSSDSTMINGIAFSIIGTIIQSVATLTIGLGLGFYYSWRIALICLGFVPIISITSVLQMKLYQNQNKTIDDNNTEAGSILSECVINTKTIFAYNFQRKAINMYCEIMLFEKKSIMKITSFGAIIFGLSQFLTYASFSLLYYLGAKFLVKGYINNYEDMNKAIFCVMFGAYGLSYAQMYVGDLGKAREALLSIFKVLNIKTEIDPYEKRGDNDNNKNDNEDYILPEDIISKADIEFKNVCFAYSTRKNVSVLNNISFKLEANKSYAFVGSSGSGKSTIVQLLERFYDITSGEILINNKNIKDYDLISLRKQVGLVLQEPVLFKRNVIENIRYGDLTSDDAKVRKAAEKAFIDKFVNDQNNEESNNLTNDTKNDKSNKNTNDKSNLSGGEKQRVAIARAIIKDPKIIIFDEATSALDKNSEEIVQKALDAQKEERTSIVVAHRLSTIVNSHKIFVMSKGEIIEEGNHEELMNKNGEYYNLFTASSSS